MNLPERIKCVKAMEYIARQINDERVFMTWLTIGVADGDLPYGDLDVPDPVPDDEAARYYCEDDTHFADLMDTFLHVMRKADMTGGLYCDDVVSTEAP